MSIRRRIGRPGLRTLGLTGLGAIALLGGCAAALPEARVTRFHLGQPISRGSVIVVPRDVQGGNGQAGPAAGGLEFASQAASISRQLALAGFQLANAQGNADFVALAEVSRDTHVTGPARSRFSIGLGGGSYGGGLGVGGGVNFPVGKTTAPQAVRTELFVQIRQRGADTPIWEGRAQLEAREGTPYASPAAAVDRLAAALFKDFPGESGRTITVK